LAFFTQNKAKLCNILIITLVFEKNANFLPKIVEYCDHNIDPRTKSYDLELQRQRCKKLQRQRCKKLQRQEKPIVFWKQSILFYLKKRSSLPLRRRCSCKFGRRRIASSTMQQLFISPGGVA
jgi:hypothetical protein